MITMRTVMAGLAMGVLGFALALTPTAPASAQSEKPEVGSETEGARGDGEWGFGRHFRGGPGLGAAMHGGPGRPGAHDLRQVLRTLDLSDSQRQEIKAVFEGERDEFGQYRDRMRALGEELEGQIHANPYDEDAVREKATALASLGVEMAVLRARQIGDVRAVLTPEQFDRLEQTRQDRKAFRQERADRFEEVGRFEQRRQRRARP